MGADPDEFPPAARKLVEAGFDVIDVNFRLPGEESLRSMSRRISSGPAGCGDSDSAEGPRFGPVISPSRSRCDEGSTIPTKVVTTSFASSKPRLILALRRHGAWSNGRAEIRRPESLVVSERSPREVPGSNSARQRRLVYGGRLCPDASRNRR